MFDFISEADADDIVRQRVEAVARDHPEEALRFAKRLREDGEPGKALMLCEAVLEARPLDEEAALLTVALLSDRGETARLLRKLAAWENSGLSSEALAVETHRQFLAAVQVYERLRVADSIEEALAICDAIVELRPGKSLLIRAQRELTEKLAFLYAERNYKSIRALAGACAAEGDSEGELAARLDLYRHPHDRQRLGIERVDNIFQAIGRLLGADQDHVDDGRIAQVQELLDALEAIPVHSLETARGEAEISAACFDRWFRLLLKTLDLRKVFGPPVTPPAPLPMRYALPDGTPADIAQLVELAPVREAQVAFLAATSPEFFQRYAEIYARSMLEAVDCNALVFVLLCCPFDRFAEVIADFPVQDPRLIFCCDDFDGQAAPDRVIRATDVEPIVLSHVYPASGLLHLDHILDHFKVPVFVTGIDTVLQAGVTDLLEEFRGYDLVLNKIGSHFGLGGQIVNNLSLIFPTAVGNAFAQFLKDYTGEHLTWTWQPAFLDQLDLHMAKHHVARIPGAKIGYFGAFEINNMMFGKDHFDKAREILRGYRFVNIFATGCEGNVLDPDEL